MKDFEVYIHIPFCIQKCHYCDFLSFSSEKAQRNAYIKALLKEIDLFFQSEESREPITIFIGGGTPSVLEAEQICEILSHIPGNAEEITIEANPGTLNRKKLESYQKAGINRLSLGLQSSNNQELKLLGRIHTWEDFLENFEQARIAGFKNINIDLISGLPGQTLQDWESVLEQTTRLCPEHISSYSLIIEEGTPFFIKYGEHPEKLPSEEEIVAMYDLTGDLLYDRGYRQYEISNYAYPGRECRHNLGYWYRRNYKGFGLGAASLLKIPSSAIGLINQSSSRSRYTEYKEKQAVSLETRFHNTNCMEEYLEALKIGTDIDTQSMVDIQSIYKDKEVLTEKEQIEETMFLGLRCRKGISPVDFSTRFGIEMKKLYGDVIEKHCNQGLLEWNENRLRLTKKALFISNMVMRDFLLD